MDSALLGRAFIPVLAGRAFSESPPDLAQKIHSKYMASVNLGQSLTKGIATGCRRSLVLHSRFWNFTGAASRLIVP